MIELTALNRQECIRYLGGAGVEMNPRMEELLNICEKEIIDSAQPKFLYKEVTLADSPFLLQGEDIQSHLKGCDKAVLICATVGLSVDNLIRRTQISDMAKAVVLDSFASVAVEQVCEKGDLLIASKYPNKHLTFRFSPGYGDYPIELQKRFLDILDAQRKIGLCTNDSFLLTPTKSVTAIMGISDKEIEQKKRGCAICTLRGECRYRKAGTHCGF